MQEILSDVRTILIRSDASLLCSDDGTLVWLSTGGCKEILNAQKRAE